MLAPSSKSRKPQGLVVKESKPALTKLEEYVKKRDFTGALAVLEFNRKTGDESESESLLWIGYCAFHLGNYHKGVSLNLPRITSMSRTVI
jgi:intraflagellar transport protein 56